MRGASPSASGLGHPVHDRAQMPGGDVDPVGQRRAIHRDAMAGEDLALAVERQVLGEVGHHDMGDQAFGRQPPSIRCTGAGTWVTPARPLRQA
jgi:hypothetical protein